jgi:hypothetical protein
MVTHALPVTDRCTREWLCREWLPSISGGKTVSLRLFLELLERCTPLLEEQPNVVALSDTTIPVLVVGPLRGHTDVCRLLAATAGKHPALNVVFLGDYIDGGANSIEALSIPMATLLALGAKRVAVLRGHHEQLFPISQRLTGALARLDTDLRWRCEREDVDPVSTEATLRACFTAMPLAAVVHGRFFCCNGGPCPAHSLVADVNAVDRTAAVGTKEGAPVLDIVGSEPADEDDDALMLREGILYARNPELGYGAVYSFPAACQFLQRNDLTTILRGSLMPLHVDPPLVSLACRPSTGRHSVYDPGYRCYRSTPIGSPSTTSLFSAPRLGGRSHNLGAVAWVRAGVVSIHQFEADPSRGVQMPRDSKRSAFEWSLPLMLAHIRSAVSWMALPDPGEGDEEGGHAEAVLQSRVRRFRRLCKHQQKCGSLPELKVATAGHHTEE